MPSGDNHAYTHLAGFIKKGVFPLVPRIESETGLGARFPMGKSPHFAGYDDPKLRGDAACLPHLIER